MYLLAHAGAVVVVKPVSSLIALRSVHPVDRYIGIPVPVVEVSYLVPYAVVLALYRFTSCPIFACADVPVSSFDNVDAHDCVFHSVILKSPFVEELILLVPSICNAVPSTQNCSICIPVFTTFHDEIVAAVE